MAEYNKPTNSQKARGAYAYTPGVKTFEKRPKAWGKKHPGLCKLPNGKSHRSLVMAVIVGAGSLAVFAALPSSEMTLADEHSFATTSQSSPCDYVNVDGQCESGPDKNPGNFVCCDGSHSHATHRNGACSHHGGICGGSGLHEIDLRKANGSAQDAG